MTEMDLRSHWRARAAKAGADAHLIESLTIQLANDLERLGVSDHDLATAISRGSTWSQILFPFWEGRRRKRGTG